MLTLFFVPDIPTEAGDVYQFANEDAQHAIRVLRMQRDDLFALSDGAGKFSHLRILDVAKKSLSAQVIETGYEEPLATHFTVIQALTKGDRLKEAIELNTAGGADRIVMWQASRSIGKPTPGAMEKLKVTAREASKQTRRLRIPSVEGVLQSKDIVDEIAKADLAIIFHESATQKLSDIVELGVKRVLIVIGPEGGITDDELELFTSCGARVAQMGRPILRSAHAGLAGLSGLNAALKIW
jgi:16S rRNA (uracil1498-N3)-methyltransferase